MRKLVKSRAKKRGLPPGTPVFVGEKPAGAAEITVIDYDEAQVLERQVTGIDECLPFIEKPSVTWININSLHDVGTVTKLAGALGLHPLVIEDILNTDHRPKLEDYGDYIYIVLKMLQWDAGKAEMIIEQVSVVLGRGYVLSFQERPGDVFESVRQRIRSGKGRVRKMSADYLAYSLLDAIVDGYFIILERRGEQIELLEGELVSHPMPTTLQDIYRLKREGLFLRRSTWPLREVVAALERSESCLICDSLGVYLRDLYDHSIQIIDTTEALRDMLSGMLDTYLSSMSNRMNEVMKVLTIIATIFIPLTFIAGVYGMNFQHMPELQWRWGYAAALGVMAAVSAVTLIFIKRKRWL